jgi:hypothetical protein
MAFRLTFAQDHQHFKMHTHAILLMIVLCVAYVVAPPPFHPSQSTIPFPKVPRQRRARYVSLPSGLPQNQPTYHPARQNQPSSTSFSQAGALWVPAQNLKRPPMPFLQLDAIGRPMSTPPGAPLIPTRDLPPTPPIPSIPLRSILRGHESRPRSGSRVHFEDDFPTLPLAPKPLHPDQINKVPDGLGVPDRPTKPALNIVTPHLPVGPMKVSRDSSSSSQPSGSTPSGLHNRVDNDSDSSSSSDSDLPSPSSYPPSRSTTGQGHKTSGTRPEHRGLETA